MQLEMGIVLSKWFRDYIGFPKLAVLMYKILHPEPSSLGYGKIDSPQLYTCVVHICAHICRDYWVLFFGASGSRFRLSGSWLGWTPTQWWCYIENMCIYIYICICTLI